MNPRTREPVSWIRPIAPESATGPLERSYQNIRDHSSSGQVSSLWQASGLDPSGLEASFAHYRALMEDPSPLSPVQAELIALVVSATNGCAYCVAHHGPRLARATGDETLARAVARDYRAANLAARGRVGLDYAVARPCEPTERKLEDLDDAAILRATEITAYYNAINRVACALGVSLEPGLEAWEFGAQK